MKKFTKLMLITLFIGVVTTGCGCKKKDTNEKKEKKEPTVQVNTNTGVIADQEVEVFKFENISLIYENNTSFFEMTVTNTSNEQQTLKDILVHVNDEDGNEIITLDVFVGDTIEAHESKLIKHSYGDNLTKTAYKVTYEIVR